MYTGIYVLQANNEFQADDKNDVLAYGHVVNASVSGLIFLSGLLFSRLEGDPHFGADFDYFRFDESVLEKPKLGTYNPASNHLQIFV